MSDALDCWSAVVGGGEVSLDIDGRKKSLGGSDALHSVNAIHACHSSHAFIAFHSWYRGRRNSVPLNTLFPSYAVSTAVHGVALHVCLGRLYNHIFLPLSTRLSSQLRLPTFSSLLPLCHIFVVNLSALFSQSCQTVYVNHLFYIVCGFVGGLAVISIRRHLSRHLSP